MMPRLCRLAFRRVFLGLVAAVFMVGYVAGPALAQSKDILVFGAALADGMGCLGVTIGRTELMFQVPTAAISEVARTLLLVGADEHSQRPS
jgi:hypothetical protein